MSESQVGTELTSDWVSGYQGRSHTTSPPELHLIVDFDENGIDDQQNKGRSGNIGRRQKSGDIVDDSHGVEIRLPAIHALASFEIPKRVSLCCTECSD